MFYEKIEGIIFKMLPNKFCSINLSDKSMKTNVLFNLKRAKVKANSHDRVIQKTKLTKENLDNGVMQMNK